jgi:DNA-binding transcriptional MerR regulator
MVNTIQNYPLYSIGVVSELLGVHPETVRTWERFGVVQPPQRRSGKRSYSEKDLRRLRFIQKLAGEGLTIRAIRYYLRLYPCWKTADCTGCANSSDQIVGAKPCWQQPETYCQVASSQDPCAGCPFNAAEEAGEETETSPINAREQVSRKQAP